VLGELSVPLASRRPLQEATHLWTPLARPAPGGGCQSARASMHRWPQLQQVHPMSSHVRLGAKVQAKVWACAPLALPVTLASRSALKVASRVVVVVVMLASPPRAPEEAP